MIRAASSQFLHLLMEVILGIAGVLALAGCAFVWRLAQGPIDLTTLVQRELRHLPAGVHITIGGAALAWEGFHDPDSPLDIRFTDLRIADASRAPLAAFPAARVTLAAAPLWRGAILPRTIVLDRADVTLHRDADGALRFDLGQTAPSSGRPGVNSLLTALTHPGAIPVLSELRLVRLERASVTLRDASLGVLWHADRAALVLRCQGSSTVTGEATLGLAVGDAQVGLASHIQLDSRGVQLVVSSTVPLSPAALARAVPTLAPLAGVDAPVTAALAVQFGTDFALRTATLSVQAAAGRVHAGRGSVAFATAAAVLQSDGDGAVLQYLRVALVPPQGSRAPGPVLTGHATARRGEGHWHADFALAADSIPFADLPAYWPAGLGGGSQPWVTGNITDGVAGGAHVSGAVDAAGDFSSVALTALSGGLEAHDMTLWWLRPVPPIEHAEAHLTIDSPDALHIDMSHGVVTGQGAGPLQLSDAMVRITGLAAKDQFGSIATSIEGALPDALALLNHPRLHLLSRRPLPLNQPGGRISARLTVRLPLAAGVTFDQIGIGATARLTDVHLGGVAAGRDLDHGALDLAVDTDQLTVNGSGRLAGVPAQIGLFMDFRAGPPSQAVESLTASGTATAAQLAGTFAVPRFMTGGAADFNVAYVALRDASATVAIGLDLQHAALASPLGWSKADGQAAHLSGRVRLLDDRLVGIDQLLADAPGLKLAGHADAQGGRPSLLVLDRALIGRTNLHGSIGLPGPADARWHVALRGPCLDLSDYLKRRDTTEPAPDDDTAGPPWQADLAADRVILARDEILAPVAAKADSDGLHMTHLDLTAGPAAQVRATIERRPGGRALSVNAADAGAVLLAAGVAGNIRGGHLRLDAAFDDTAPHAPLAGTAVLDSFRLLDAPAIGRLLKAMTLYGAVDLLRGPGMGFQKAEAKFRWQQRVLHLATARAFSASLGLTAQGDIDLAHHTADVTGTIVPAYFFNHLLGDIPLVGKLFSPEAGSGVFAARYSVRGKLTDPKIGVNPLSALTPGFLRNVFGLL
jgi:hypothetical protein